MKITVFQFSPAFAAVRQNIEKIEGALDGLRTDLVVLPELCTTGYLFASPDDVGILAEPIPGGESVRRFETLCRRNRFHMVAGIAESAGASCYNSAVLVGPGGWIGAYRKIHLFWKEKTWFAPGNSAFRAWDIGSVRVGLMVCFDWIYPEAARSLALQGADILCHPANLVLPYCPDAMVTRSVENRVFAVTANRIGSEERDGIPKLTFIGRSQAVGPSGEILFRMGETEEGIRTVEINPRLARDKKIMNTNDLWLDRRPELYALPSSPACAGSGGVRQHPPRNRCPEGGDGG